MTTHSDTPKDAMTVAEMYDAAMIENDRLRSEISALTAQLAECRRDAEIGRRWRKNNSLTEWFPFTAEELARLRDRSNNLFGALLEFHNAFHNRGETTSLYEWNERMRQADERACQILPIPPIDAAIQESKK